MAYSYSHDFQDFVENDMGQSHTQATGAQRSANGHSGINNHTEAGQDIRSGSESPTCIPLPLALRRLTNNRAAVADTAPANEGGPQEQAEMFNAYSPSWAEIKELIPIPWSPMTIERYKMSVRARLLNVAREDNEKEVALGPVTDAEEPTPDDITSITAHFEAPPLWKGKWMARAVRREIITSRHRHAGPPTNPQGQTIAQAFVDVLGYVRAFEENHASAPGITDSYVWAASEFMGPMAKFCYLALFQRWYLKDAFINLAAKSLKSKIYGELKESRSLSTKPWKRQPSLGNLDAYLDQRFGPALSRMPHLRARDRRRVYRDIVWSKRLFYKCMFWAHRLVYSGHRGPWPIENSTNSRWQLFVIDTAVGEFTKMRNGVQDGDHNGAESGSDAGTWRANLRLTIRRVVAMDHFWARY